MKKKKIQTGQAGVRQGSEGGGFEFRFCFLFWRFRVSCFVFRVSYPT